MRFLIVKTSSLGDIIHAFPVLSYLHTHYPEAKIDWAVESPFAELVESHPYVNNVHRTETRQWRKGRNLKAFLKFIRELRCVTYDCLFDFQGNTKSALVTAVAKAKKKVGFGKKSVSEWPNLFVTNFRYDPPIDVNVRQENLHLVQSHFGDRLPFEESGLPLMISDEQGSFLNQLLYQKELGCRKKIMVCPGSAWPNKQMTPAAFIHFLKGVSECLPSFFFLVWGNNQEQLLTKEIYNALPGQCLIIDKLPIPLLQNLMGGMDLVIAMDSLPLHLAATTSTRTYSIFGASAAAKFGPEGEHHRSFQGICPYGKTFHRRCPILRTCDTGACIRSLTGSKVLSHFRERILTIL